jgi:hypothetical protein
MSCPAACRCIGGSPELAEVPCKLREAQPLPQLPLACRPCCPSFCAATHRRPLLLLLLISLPAAAAGAVAAAVCQLPELNLYLLQLPLVLPAAPLCQEVLRAEPQLPADAICLPHLLLHV